MESRTIQRLIGQAGVIVLGLATIVASGPAQLANPPTHLALQVPAAATGGKFVPVHADGSAGANTVRFRALPLLTAEPVVKISFQLPVNTLPTIQAGDATLDATATTLLNQCTTGTCDPVAGYWVLQSVTPWTLLVQLPSSLSRAKAIRIEVLDNGAQDQMSTFLLVPEHRGK